MRADVVIGAGFGDEGKGLMTDYLARHREWPLVIRFNGGAQAGHTVVTPEGQRHVFSHFGAGTLAGVPTFLSKHFLVNPLLWYKEFLELGPLLRNDPELYIDPECPVTLPADMLINQFIEEARGGLRHGSCGVGIGETVVRHQVLSVTVADLLGHTPNLDRVELEAYAHKRVELLGLELSARQASLLHLATEGATWQRFKSMASDMLKFSNVVPLRLIGNTVKRHFIFEGAQGLLLDQNRTQDMPHLTRSNTGLQNVQELLYHDLPGVEGADVHYVMRPYMTRHGSGPLPTGDYNLVYEDNTNMPNPWQGNLRFGKFDSKLLGEAILKDYMDFGNPRDRFYGVVTHLDQVPDFKADVAIESVGLSSQIYFTSHGPTWKDVIKHTVP